MSSLYLHFLLLLHQLPSSSPLAAVLPAYVCYLLSSQLISTIPSSQLIPTMSCCVPSTPSHDSFSHFTIRIPESIHWSGVFIQNLLRFHYHWFFSHWPDDLHQCQFRPRLRITSTWFVSSKLFPSIFPLVCLVQGIFPQSSPWFVSSKASFSLSWFVSSKMFSLAWFVSSKLFCYHPPIHSTYRFIQIMPNAWAWTTPMK